MFYDVDWVRAMYGGTSALDYEIIKDIAGEASVVNGLAAASYEPSLLNMEDPETAGLFPAAAAVQDSVPSDQNSFNIWPVVLLGLGAFLLFKGGK